MSHILDTLRKRRELLRNLKYNEDKARLGALLEWLDSNAETKLILDKLRVEVDVASLMPSSTGYPRPPKAVTPEEVHAFGLHLMEKCGAGLPLHTLAHKYNIKPSFRTNRVQDYVDEAMTAYVNPFLDYVESDLEQHEEAITAEKVAEFRFGHVLSSDFRKAFRQTGEAFDRIGNFLMSSHAEESWFNVGTMCREAMNTFIRELRGQNLIDVTWPVKQGDTKGILKRLIAGTGCDGQFGDTLAALVDAAWGHAACIVHRTLTTKTEALRAYLWTAMVLAEVFFIIRLPSGNPRSTTNQMSTDAAQPS
jgi:hypothetical protein